MFTENQFSSLLQALSDYSVVYLLVDSPKCKVLINRALLYLELGDWANSLLDFISAGNVRTLNFSASQHILTMCIYSLLYLGVEG